MLRKEAMAKKVAKYMLSEVVKDSSDNTLKASVLEGLEKAYMGGYDLAVQECRDDNSNPGHEMADYLQYLNDDGTISYDE